MLLHACAGKIHRATVTQAELDYVGSITIDEDLLDAAGIVPYQYLNITNLRNGVYWRTYAIAGKRGNGDICLNGPPARHFKKGDIIVILAEVLVEPREMATLDPVVVFVDTNNKITEIKRHTLVPHPLA
jgi:aspartate 1-decarboxylase